MAAIRWTSQDVNYLNSLSDNELADYVADMPAGSYGKAGTRFAAPEAIYRGERILAERRGKIKQQLKNQYNNIIKLEPKARYSGRSSDLEQIFDSQAARLDRAGVTNIADIKKDGKKIVNSANGKVISTLVRDPDTKIDKWGEIGSNVKGIGQFGISFAEDGSAVFYPVYEKSKSPLAGIGLGGLEGIITPILTIAGGIYGVPGVGAIAGAGLGAAAGNTVGQLLASGEVDFDQVIQAGATAAALSPGSTGAVGDALGLSKDAAKIAGGAVIGAGISELAGGDALKGAIAGAIGAVGSTTYATSVGETLGATGAAAPIVGNAVINAGLSGIAAAATGGNIEKSMLDGAIKGAAVAGSTEFAEAILGKDNIASIAKAAGLEDKQIASIFTTSVANGVTAEISGQGEFLETVGISLAAQGVGAKSADLMKGAMKDVLDKDPEIMAGVLTATNGIAQTATSAALQGMDVGEALERNAPGIILSSVQTYQSEADRQDAIKAAEATKRAAEQEIDAEIGGFETPPPPVQGDFPAEIEAINQTALDIASGKIQVAGLPFLAIGASVGAHAALAYLVSQYELLFPGDVQAQQQALEANPIYIEIQAASPSTVKSEIDPTTSKPKLTVKPRPEIAPQDATQLEDVTIKVKSDPSLAEAQRISDDVFELLKQLFQEPPPPPEPEIPPPEPVRLPPGAPADQAPGVTGEEGQRGVAGGITGLDLQKRPTVSGQPLREDIFNRILTDELNRLEDELQKADKEQKQAESNLQRAQEQQRKFSTPDIIAVAGPGLAEVLEEELNIAARSAEEARAAREAAASQRSEIGALQRGEATFSDEQLLDYLRTGQLPLGGGEGTGEPGTRGPGTGADEEGPGPGGLEEGDESGAGDRGVGTGAGQEGTEVGGGGEGEGGIGELRTPLRPSLIFDRETGGRPETTPFASRVTGEALASILGEKEPLFGGDEDEQRAVWNRRSLRLLSRALGL